MQRQLRQLKIRKICLRCQAVIIMIITIKTTIVTIITIKITIIARVAIVTFVKFIVMKAIAYVTKIIRIALVIQPVIVAEGTRERRPPKTSHGHTHQLASTTHRRHQQMEHINQTRGLAPASHGRVLRSLPSLAGTPLAIS